MLRSIASVSPRQVQTKHGPATKYDVVTTTNENAMETWSPWLASLCERAQATGRQVLLGLRETKWAWEIVSADLTGADLTGADLTDANLRGADLRGANLTGANLIAFRDDFWAVLSSAPNEVPALIAALREGRVDGSTYTGECACLVGTIANARHCDVNAIPGLRPNSSRLAEVFFLGIKKGDTPETNVRSKEAVAWAEDWLTRMRDAFGATA